MVAMASFVCHGVLERFPDLGLAFLEGGCGWLVCMLDRLKWDEGYFAGKARRSLPQYIAGGQIPIGCEG